MRVDVTLPPDLTGYIAGAAGALEFSRQRLKGTIKELTPEQLAQVPAGFSNSIATLVVHVCGTEVNMAHRIMGGAVADDLKREFLLEKAPGGLLTAATGETVASLNAKMDKSREMLMGVLGRLAESDLNREMEFSGGRQVTVRWCLALLPSHESQHLGQIQMIQKLLK